MKKSSFAFLSMLALSSASFGQSAASYLNGPAISGGTFQLSSGGKLQNLSLCTHEICQKDKSGKIQISPVASGSISAIIAQASSPEGNKYLVFYPVGEERNPNARRILRNRFILTLSEGANLEEVRQRCGIKSMKLVSPGSNVVICEEESAGKVLGQLTSVLSDPDVVSAEPLFARKRFTRLIPTDPFYDTVDNPRDDESYQWYLNNIGVNGGVADIDINLEGDDPDRGALDRATGEGITIGIVDDGLAIDHIDLADNAVGPHLNLRDGDPDDPSTLDSTLNHGTNVAGLIAASFNNDEGISGVAPNAELSGIRLLGDGVDDAEEAQALAFRNDVIDIYNASWGPDDTTLSLEGPGSLTAQALRLGVENGRPVDPDDILSESLGSIFVWAAGDGGLIGDNSNYDGYANSKFTIAVGSVTDAGNRAPYSERGANVVVVAPSSGGAADVLTTSYSLGLDQDDNPIRISEYDNTFGGTSASAALVSGVVALMLEENPLLTWRDVQDILIRTAFKVDPQNGEWITNGANIDFNQNYGAGMVDALAAVNEALAVTPALALGPQVSNIKSRFFSVDADVNSEDNGSIPDNNGESLLVEFDMTQSDAGADLANLRVEHVELSATIITERRSDLEIVIISPNGTESVLQDIDLEHEEQSIVRWSYMTVRNWGEGSAGTWVVRITDRISGNVAVVNNMSLIVNGSADDDAPVSQIPILTSTRFLALDQGADTIYRVETSGATSVEVGDLPPGLVYDPLTGVISGAPTVPGLYSVPIVLRSDVTEDGVFSLSIVVRPTAVALGDAVGLPGTPAVFGGDLPWDFELIDTNDGDIPEPRSARSAVNLGDNEQSIFGFDNIPAGVLFFDWKTSSEEGADRLWFNRGGNVPQEWDAFISGEREWGRAAVALPEAVNSIRWIYSKNESESEGDDRGLVDNVEFVEASKFREDIRRAANVEGLELEFGSSALFYPFEFRSGSSSPGGVPEVIRSSTVGNGQTVSLTGSFTGPGVFSFDSFNFGATEDVLEFLFDGVVVSTAPGSGSGAVSRLNVSRNVGAGKHWIEIRYRKSFRGSDARTIGGEFIDGITVDNLSFVPENGFLPFLAQYGPGVSADPSADSDSDGYTNHNEYAFGGDLMIADVPKYLPKLIESGESSYIEYGIDTNRQDLNYIAQQSVDLDDWVDAENSQLERTEGSVEVYRIPVNAAPGNPNLFYRVVARNK